MLTIHRSSPCVQLFRHHMLLLADYLTEPSGAEHLTEPSGTTLPVGPGTSALCFCLSMSCKPVNRFCQGEQTAPHMTEVCWQMYLQTSNQRGGHVQEETRSPPAGHVQEETRSPAAGHVQEESRRGVEVSGVWVNLFDCSKDKDHTMRTAGTLKLKLGKGSHRLKQSSLHVALSTER